MKKKKQKKKINFKVKKVSIKRLRKKRVPFDTILKSSKLRVQSSRLFKIIKVHPVRFRIHKVLTHLHRPHMEHAVFLGLGLLIFLGFTFFYPLIAKAEVFPVSTEVHFNQNSEPEFILKTKGLIKTSEEKKGERELNLGSSKIKVEVKHKDKLIDVVPVIETIPEKEDQFKVTLKNTPQFSPGKYSLKIDLSTSLRNQIVEQDFSWGVLAINPDQSIYAPGSEAFIGMAVLDDKGDMVDDAMVVLEIISPDGKNTILSTENGTIKISPQINYKGVTELPDYYTTYKTNKIGEYQMKLKAETANGIREMEDRFYVESKPKFEVRRDGHTRIYPFVPYQMKLEIKANLDSSGPVKEYVPASFKITKQPGLKIEERNQFKILTWNQNFRKGEQRTLVYEYDAPDVSPQFYLLNPLEIGKGRNKFEEKRQWQIAADSPGAIEYYVARREADETKTTSSWSVVTGTAGSGTTGSLNGWIDSSNFTADERYLIMIWGAHNNSSLSEQSGIRVVHGDTFFPMTAFTESQAIEEADRTNAMYKTEYFWFTVWTAAENESIEVEYYNSSTTTARVEDITLMAINAEDLITNNDLKYDIDTTGGTLTTTPTAKASITWTPENNNDTWWVSGYSQADIVDIDSDQFEAQLDIDSTDRSVQSIEGEDSTDTPVYGLGWAQQLSNSSHTASVELSESAADEEWDAAGIFALRLDTFEDFAIDTTAGDQELSAGLNIFNEIGAVSPTPQTSGDWVVTGGFIADDNDGRVRDRIQKSGSNIWRINGGYQHNVNDLVPHTGMDLNSFTTSQQNIDFDATETLDQTPNPDATDAWLVSFSMELNEIDVSGSAKQYDQSTNASNLETVKVAVNGTLQTQTGSTSSGSWTISGIRKPDTDDVITVFIDNVANSNEANAVTTYDYSGNITGVLLYEEHLTIGSDDNQTVNNNDASQYDNSVSGDEDIFFDVDGSNNLTVDSLTQSTQEELYIKASNTYYPDASAAGNVTTHDIEIDGTLTVSSSTVYIEGSWDNDSVFNSNTSIVYMAATSGTETVDSTGASTASFASLGFGPYLAIHTTTWNLSSALDVNTQIVINDGTFAMNGSNDINLAGNLQINTGGVYTKGTGTFTFDGSGTSTWTDSTSGQDMGTVSVNGSSKTINLSSSVKATSLNVASGQTFGLGSSGYTLLLTGSGTGGSRPFISSGTLNEGTNSTFRFGGTSATEIESETYDVLDLHPTSDVNPTYTLGTASSQSITTDDLLIGNEGDAAPVTATAATYNPTLDVNGDLTITTDSDFTASASASFTVGGSWSNDGSFTHSSGSITFDTTATGKTIDSGGSNFNNLTFNSGSGGWTIQTSNLTAVGDFTITDTAASGFTVDSVTLEVQGTYSIADAETSNTTWTSATLYLSSASPYTVGSKTQNAETYSTLQIGANTDIRIWNSSATTYTVDSSGSLYSQDHANTNGDLYIWGDYHTQTNDYWSYATDFDGTSLSGGSERQVDVRINEDDSVTVDSGDTLAAIGESLNRTDVDVLVGAGFNGYDFIVAQGTINFQYCDFDYLNGEVGLDIQASSTVTSLANCAFDNLNPSIVGSANAFITVASSVIGTAETNFTGVQFDNTGSGADFNVNRTGNDSAGWWYFDTSTGTFDGEANDGKEGVNEADPGMLRWDDSAWGSAPNDPTSLAQKKTDDTVISTGGWTNETAVKGTATASDPDNPDTLYLQLEVKDINTAFDGTGIETGSGVAYSGTPVTVTVTVSGLSDNTEYHWRARVKDEVGNKSNWVAYGGNSEGPPADRDFGTDTTAPTGGTVYDGASGDQDWNDGSLTTLEANWTGFDSSVSGLQKYQYAMRRKPDDYYWNESSSVWQLGESWNDNGTNTSVQVNSINLQTGVIYYASVRAVDNADNTGSSVDSNGQQVLPTLSFTMSTNSITFADLNNANNWTDSQNANVTTSTNAASGYTVSTYITQLLTSLAYPSETIANFYGTWANPELWPLGTYGFGYTSSDTSVQGSNRFNSGTEYAGFSQTASGDIFCDHTDAVNGSTGAVSNEQFTITFKVAVAESQVSSAYQTNAVCIVTANY